MENELAVDLAPLLAAIIQNEGGEVRIPYSLLVDGPPADVALSIDLENDGSELVFRLVPVEEIPEDVLS